MTIDAQFNSYARFFLRRASETSATSKSKTSDSLLRTMEGAGLNPPSDCRSGRCGRCRSQRIAGEVYIPESVDGRRQADKDFGYIHPCCSFPLSDVELDVPPMPTD